MLPRSVRALTIALSAFIIATTIASISGVTPKVQKASIGSAYAALSLLAVTFALGPLSVLRTRRYPVSTVLRRDCGIAAALLALLHTIIGLRVHMKGDIARYFLPSSTHLQRSDILFLSANHLGLISALVLTALLFLSNDWSLRKLGSTKWKRWQRSAYFAGAFAIVHGAFYQIVENRRVALVALFAAMIAVVVFLQLFARSRRLKNSFQR